MSLYLDANILVSMFVTDQHTELLSNWLVGVTEPLLVSPWAVAEFSSALGVRRRTGTLGQADRETAEWTLDRWLEGGVQMIEPAAADFVLARQLMRSERTQLKAPDALHLATAVRARVTVVTLDRQLGRAAEDLGLAVEAF